MRSTSTVNFDDYQCEVRSHSLESLEQGVGNSRCDAVVSCHDPESSPQEHSAAHPARFDTEGRCTAKP